MRTVEKFLGIMQLDTNFGRIRGDIGNAASYDFPVRIAIVSGANVQRVVVDGDPNLLDPFIETAQQLVAEGAYAITTSCGFLAPFQAKIAQAVDVPIFISSLLQIPLAYAMTQSRIGIITANGETLNERHFKGVGVSADIPLVIKGLHDQAAFHEMIFQDSPTINPQQIEREVCGVVQDLMAEYPDLGAFVFECHNLAPYAPAVAEMTGRPVFDIISFAHWVHSTVYKQVFL